jgi:hypothetical protein
MLAPSSSPTVLFRHQDRSEEELPRITLTPKPPEDPSLRGNYTRLNSTSALGVAALSAIRKKDSYANAQFHRIAARRGGKRAQSAVAHSILIALWHILDRHVPYEDLGVNYFTHRDPDRQRRRAIAQLERLGYTVTIDASAA